MVLQRDMPVPIWGTADNGEKVTVQFNGQSASTVATDGKWMVRLKPLSPGGPFALTINTITLNNILVGDVWLCGGQSNMERQLGPRPPQPLIDNWQQEDAAADFPQLRFFTVRRRNSADILPEVRGDWSVCTPATAKNFSAVGFFFGRDLQNSIHVPIGLIHSSIGGTSARLWTRQDALAKNPLTAGIVDAFNSANKKYLSALAEYNATEKTATTKPKPPSAPAGDADQPGGFYNGMIAPLQPFAIRGVIWYQGENDAGRAVEYRTLFPLMIVDWRAQWGQGDFPFLFVQVAPFPKTSPKIREAQLLTAQATANTAMIVTTDIGDPNNIHPSHKQAVGARLALAARALSYGEKLEYSGPIFKSMSVDAGHVILTFTHVGSGLVAKDGQLKGFTVAGSDGKFVPAQAEIKNDTVVVSSDAVQNPTAVHYGWAAVPDVNLFNKDGLPASPFRTDAN